MDNKHNNEIIQIAISDIKVGTRFRKQLGDLATVAEDINSQKLLQPIGITPDYELVFGLRRLLACRDILGWSEITAHIVHTKSILDGQISENCIRKQYVISEMVDIVDAMRSFSHGGDRRSNQRSSSDVETLTVGEIAKRVGLGGKHNYSRAKRVIEHGDQALIEAMDRGDVSVAAAAEFAKLPATDQKVMLTEKSEWTAKEVQSRQETQPATCERNVESAPTIPVKTSGSTWRLTGNEETIACNLLIVDPPYGILNEEWEPSDLETFTKQWAARWACCGAEFIAIFYSQRHIWEGRRWFDESLSGYTFQQAAIWHAPNNCKPKSRAWLKQSYEPVLIYRRNGSDQLVRDHGSIWTGELHDLDCHIASVPQSGYGGHERKTHPCQKPVSVMKWLINALSKTGQTVVSLFSGSSPCGIAALQLRRDYIGIESNAEYRKVAEDRIKAFGRPECTPPVPVKVIERDSVVHGDCLDLIPSLPDRSINLALTSPPYSDQRRGQYPGVSSRLYAAFTEQWMSKLWDKMTDDGSVLIVIRPDLKKGVVNDYVLRMQLALREMGWKECERLIWEKLDGGACNGSHQRPRRTYEDIYWFSKSNKPYVDMKACGIWRERVSHSGAPRSDQSKNRPAQNKQPGQTKLTDIIRVPVRRIEQGIDHPAMFPVELAEVLIKSFCPIAGIVLDPFAGSGSTLVAASNHARSYYGFDIKSEYCEIARDRLSRAVAQRPPISKTAASGPRQQKPVSKAS